MTREQLIREMIQIELLYQTRQKLLKETEEETDEINDDENSNTDISNNNSNVVLSAQAQKIKDNITKTIKEQHHQLYSIGNSSDNDFINSFDKKVVDWATEKNFKGGLDESKNRIVLKGVYLNDDGKQKYANQDLNTIKKDELDGFKKKITELTYDELKSNPDDITAIWQFLEKKMHYLLLIPKKALESIIKIFKAADEALGQKVFSIFGPNSQQFNLQGLDYNGKVSEVAEKINSKLSDSIIKDVYRNKSKDESQTFNTGRGEFLAVLLIKGAKSGGTRFLDVIVGDKQFDVKQISQHGDAQPDDLSLTLSVKSGIRDSKNRFIENQAKLGRKISELSTEFKKLGINEELIKKLEKIEDGYTSTAFKRSNTEIVDDDDSDSHFSFVDLGDIIKQGLMGLKANTYSNIVQLKEFKKNNFTTNYYSNNDNQLSNNIHDEVIRFLKSCYNLDLKKFNEFVDNKTNKIKFPYEKEIKFIDIKSDNGGLLFKKFNVDAYNTLINNNIDKQYNTYFKIQPQCAPIMSLIVSNKINPEDYKTFKDNLDFTIIGADAAQNITNFKNNYGKTKEEDLSTLNNSFRGKVNKTLNNQIILTVAQMKKINEIIKKNDDIDLTKIGAINNNTVIGDEYYVTEPLKNSDNGEFIIDISYYNNKKKKHVDTLYSQDFKIKDSTNNKLSINNKTKEINKDVKDAIAKVQINLSDVISDRDTINNKLKNFELFNNLQPSVLKDLLNSEKNKYSLLKNNKNNEIDFLSDNTFKSNLKSIKEKTKEDNILNIIYEMYDSCNKIEEKIKQYYATENDILIFKDNGTSKNGDSTPSAAYSWNNVLTILKDANCDSFITQIQHNAIICYSNNMAPPAKFNTVKNVIKDLFNEVMDLMLELQSITTK
jgi:hypothetical protein